jgi:hypothetical protein
MDATFHTSGKHTMKPKQSKRMTPAEQSARFIEAAKKAEADERPEEFEKVLKKIATPKLAKPLYRR